MKSLFSLWSLVKNDRHLALLNIGFNLLASVFSVFSLLMLIPFLQVLFYGESVGQPANNISEVPILQYLYKEWMLILQEKGRNAALIALCLSLIVAFVFKNTFRFLALFVLAPLRTGIMMQLRQQIYAHLMKLGYPFFQRSRRGDIMTRFGQDVQEVEYGIVNFIEIGLKEPATILITLISLIWMSPLLTIWVIILLPVSAWVIGRIGKFLKKQSYEAQQHLSLLQAMVDELIHGIRIIRSLGAADRMETAFKGVNHQYRKLHTSMLRRKELASPLSEVMGISVVAALLMIGGRWVLSGQGSLTPEVFITYIVVFSQMISPAKAFANAWYFIQKGVASLQRIQELLHEAPDEKRENTSISKQSFDTAISIKDLNYSFGNHKALNNMNIRIQKGEKLAIVGPSGGGKTTLINLLSGFYQTDSNSIYIDDVPLNNIAQEDWQQLFAIVTQEPLLFFGTIRDNILMAAPVATDEQIWAALSLADAIDFVQQMPNGLDSTIGERGVQLSGGQQQRLALARAFLRNAPILLLDEATASLDSQSDEWIREVLKRLENGRTVIAIAHRLSSIRYFDRIVVIENGNVTGDGTHEELIATHKVYQLLVAGQNIN